MQSDEMVSTSPTAPASGMPAAPFSFGSAALEMRDTTGNPAPLGLLAFGATTVLLNLHNAGVFGLNTMILSMGIFYGGLAQLLAGLLEWKKNNTFGMTAFISYGMFWLSLVGLILLPSFQPSVHGPSAGAMACYLAVWGLFTAGMFVGTLRLTRALQFVFGSLTILFVLLALGAATGAAWVGTLAGYEGIICGLSAMYTGMAIVLNEVYGRTVLPVGVRAA